jgi:hypothetical protein
MDYGRAGYNRISARNSSQINAAITTGRPRVLHRSIIPSSITRIDLSRAASFVCRPPSRTNDPVAWQPFYFAAALLSFRFRLRREPLAAIFAWRREPPPKRKPFVPFVERERERERIVRVGGIAASSPALNPSSGGGYFFPR